MHLRSGTILQGGKYQIIRALGQGGFGITYEAEQVALMRTVAIKEFFMKDYCDRDGETSHVSVPTENSRDLVDGFKQKFLKEAQMIASLRNPHIVSIYDVFEENGTAYYVMEYLRNGSLIDIVKKRGPLPEAEAIRYINQVGEALTYLHERSFLHLDVKPSNILFNDDGEPVLIDFGISKHYDETGGQTSTTPVGISKGYAPIEQYQQGSIIKFSPATDVYSLGATLFFLLTGCTPPEAAEVNEDGIPDLGKGVSLATKDAINAAMAPKRKERPQSVKDFLDLLRDNASSKKTMVSKSIIIGGSSIEDESTLVLSKPKDNHQDLLPSVDYSQNVIVDYEPNKKNAIKLILFSLGILLVLVALILFLFNKSDSSTSNQTNETQIIENRKDIFTINGAPDNTLSFPDKGGTEVLRFYKNFSEGWTFNSPSWCKVDTTSSKGRITIICERNMSVDERAVSIVFLKKGSSDVLASLRIKQDGYGTARNDAPTESQASEIKVTAIQMQKNLKKQVQVGESFFIDHTVIPLSASKRKVSWSSSDNTVATVRADGIIVAKNSGVTTITAVIDDVRATCDVEIQILSDVDSNSKNDSDLERAPTFQGGDSNTFSLWVNSHLNYPKEAKDNGVQGTVRLSFTIDVDGSVTDVKVIRGVDPVLDAEAVRVVSSSPKWTPGYQSGRNVRVTYTFPIIFHLE